MSKQDKINDIKYARILWLNKEINRYGELIYGKEKWKRLKLSRDWHLYH
jgi:hypothetical protein